MSKQKILRVDITDGAVIGLEQLKVITGRPTPESVIIDALRIYEWILQEQFHRQKIVSMNGGSENEVELVSYIKDKEAAAIYFENLNPWKMGL